MVIVFQLYADFPGVAPGVWIVYLMFVPLLIFREVSANTLSPAGQS